MPIFMEEGHVLEIRYFNSLSLAQRIGFLRRFGLITGIHFAHVGLESGMVLEETTGCMNVFILSILNE